MNLFKWCCWVLVFSLCGSPLLTQAAGWRPLYRLQYPEQLTPEEFLSLVTSLRIKIAMPLSAKEFTCLPPHRHVTEVTTIEHGPRFIRPRLVWEPICVITPPGALTMSVKPNEIGYAQSKALLISTGLWDSVPAKYVYHLYPQKLADQMEALWQERWRSHQFTAPDVRNLQLREVTFGFQRCPHGHWSLRVEKLTYYY